EASGRLARWGLGISDPGDAGKAPRAVITLGNTGLLHVDLWHVEGEAAKHTTLEPLPHPALRNAKNLLVVLRGRQLEVYVNAVAVCDPILLDQEVRAPLLSLASANPTGKPISVEFESITVWPAKDIPPPEKRGAMPKEK